MADVNLRDAAVSGRSIETTDVVLGIDPTETDASAAAKTDTLAQLIITIFKNITGLNATELAAARAALGVVQLPKWVAKTWNVGDQAIHDEIVYQCLATRSSANTQNPAGDTTGWLKVAPLSKVLTDRIAASVPKYAAATTYAKGALVVDAEFVWISIVASNQGNSPASDDGSNWLTLTAYLDIFDVDISRLKRSIDEILHLTRDIRVIASPPAWNAASDSEVDLIIVVTDNFNIPPTGVTITDALFSGAGAEATTGSTAHQYNATYLRVADGTDISPFRSVWDGVSSKPASLWHKIAGPDETTYDYYWIQTTLNAVNSRVRIQKYGSLERTEYLGKVLDSAVLGLLLPTFPSAGDRDLKRPQFEGDTLKWLAPAHSGGATGGGNRGRGVLTGRVTSTTGQTAGLTANTDPINVPGPVTNVAADTAVRAASIAWPIVPLLAKSEPEVGAFFGEIAADNETVVLKPGTYHVDLHVQNLWVNGRLQHGKYTATSNQRYSPQAVVEIDNAGTWEELTRTSAKYIRYSPVADASGEPGATYTGGKADGTVVLTCDIYLTEESTIRFRMRRGKIMTPAQVDAADGEFTAQSLSVNERQYVPWAYYCDVAKIEFYPYGGASSFESLSENLGTATFDIAGSVSAVQVALVDADTNALVCPASGWVIVTYDIPPLGLTASSQWIKASKLRDARTGSLAAGGLYCNAAGEMFFEYQTETAGNGNTIEVEAL